jgi:glutamine amidotransferase
MRRWFGRERGMSGMMVDAGDSDVVAIVDYGGGNVRSVANAVSRLGYRSRVTGNAGDVVSAAAVILPGVGAAADTMRQLERSGLSGAVRQVVTDNRPLLAICVGMQVLLDSTEEGGRHDCLGVVPGAVRRLPPGLKVPHIGWNQVKQKVRHAIFEGIPDETDFYFVHSYYAEPEEESVVAATTEYGVTFCAAVVSGNLVATQFHPERSGEYGLRMYRNFLNMALSVKESKHEDQVRDHR